MHNSRHSIFLSHLSTGMDSKISPSDTVCDSTQKADDIPLFHGEPLKWNGWGFADSGFIVNNNTQVGFSGKRYPLSGCEMPKMKGFVEDVTDLKIEDYLPGQKFNDIFIPPPIINEEFIKNIEEKVKRIDLSDGSRCQEMFDLRFSSLSRVVDLVVYPSSHHQVEIIVSNALKYNVVLIPFGGGTSVSQALLCPTNEERMIVSVDMHEMSNILWVDKSNMMVCIESGAVGVDIDRMLASYGLYLGMEPDSYEFSTLGGWVATCASGMKKNLYGNIEDIVHHLRCVTPKGTIEKSGIFPRVSIGPDIHQCIIGSEGSFGIVTEVVVKVRPLPEMIKYGSIIFPDFSSGVKFMREVAFQRIQPASIRLVDNNQFRFGQCLKPAAGWTDNILDQIKKWYVVHGLSYDPEKMVVCTLLFEGPASQIIPNEKLIYDLAKKYGGMSAGEDNGIRGYNLTFMIAYIRDFCFEHWFMAESFETSVPWNNVEMLCQRVSERIISECHQHGVPGKPFISYRVTQTYDIGACVYFYFGFTFKGLDNPVNVYNQIEHSARDEVINCGGSLSHHHGVGKIRQSFLKDVQSPAVDIALKGIKESLDPTNIFAAGNLMFK